MVTKTKTPKSKLQSRKLKIIVEHLFGPYESVSGANTAKTAIRKKVGKITFTNAVKKGNGHYMKGRMTYVKAVKAPAEMVKQHLQNQIPGAKITVTKA
ncbi:MAG TPA: hypothetical protein VGK38_12195 [Prolixibacteraceae bacterium]